MSASIDAHFPEWTTVRLNDERYFEWETGLWKGTKPPFTQIGVVRNTNFTNTGELDFRDVAYLNVESRHLPKKALRAGDIIVERSGGGPKQPVGRVALFESREGTFSFSNFTARLRIRDTTVLNTRFVHLFLHHFHAAGGTLTLQQNTTGIRNLRFNDYMDLVIPVPPIDEQRRIVEVVETAKAARKVEEGRLQTLRELKAAALFKSFSEGLHSQPSAVSPYGAVPSHWRATSLATCGHIQTGVTKGRVVSDADAVEVPYLRVANVQDGFLDLSEIKTIKILAKDLARFSLRRGDVLLTEGGDFDKLGRGYIWNEEVSPCIHQNHVFAVRVDSEKLMPEFFAYMAQSAYGKRYFLTVAHKTTNLACINSTKLRDFPVLLAPQDEQYEIVELLRSIDRRLSASKQRLTTLNVLVATLTRDLITGGVRADRLSQSTEVVNAYA